MLAYLLFAVIATTWWIRRRSHKAPLPPGPPADPFIGHLRALSAGGNTAEKFNEWAQTYGDVMSFWLPGRQIIVLNSDDAANDLLNKQSAIFSSRPSMPIYEEMGWHHVISFTPYGKEMMKQKKLLTQTLNQKKTEEYYHINREETKIMLRKLVKTPEKFHDAVMRYSAAVVVKISYGHDIRTDDDDYLKWATTADHALNYGATVGITALDCLPWLKNFPSWFPGTFYANKARELRSDVEGIYNNPYDDVMKQIKEGNAQPSFLEERLRSLTAEGVTDEEAYQEAKGVAATLFVAGVDTTSATLGIFAMLMIKNPKCFKRLQKEIDDVVGHDRLPDFSDRDHMPYTEAVVLETLRWFPIVSAGLAHVSTEDYVYKGMFIPKGSVVQANNRGITWDERVYKNPRKFMPERFLPVSQGGLGEPPAMCVFGYGRRLCPGRFFAQNSFWLLAASLVQSFDFAPPLGPTGQEEPPHYEVAPGQVSHLKPFDFQLKLRSPKAAEIIMQGD